MNEFERIKLYLLTDIIDDILSDKNLKFTEKHLYKQIKNNLNKLTKIYTDNHKTDLSDEYDIYKEKINDYINIIMKESINNTQ